VLVLLAGIELATY